MKASTNVFTAGVSDPPVPEPIFDVAEFVSRITSAAVPKTELGIATVALPVTFPGFADVNTTLQTPLVRLFGVEAGGLGSAEVSQVEDESTVMSPAAIPFDPASDTYTWPLVAAT
jgi:hypothetical protein